MYWQWWGLYNKQGGLLSIKRKGDTKIPLLQEFTFPAHAIRPSGPLVIQKINITPFGDQYQLG